MEERKHTPAPNCASAFHPYHFVAAGGDQCNRVAWTENMAPTVAMLIPALCGVICTNPGISPQAGRAPSLVRDSAGQHDAPIWPANRAATSDCQKRGALMAGLRIGEAKNPGPRQQGKGGHDNMSQLRIATANLSSWAN